MWRLFFCCVLWKLSFLVTCQTPTTRNSKGIPISSDVVETVTSETETWLKFRDKTETLSQQPRPRTGSSSPRLETSHFSGGNECYIAATKYLAHCQISR